LSNGFIDPTASRAGVPHTVLRGAMVHDAFPSFPPTQKKKKKKKIFGLPSQAVRCAATPSDDETLQLIEGTSDESQDAGDSDSDEYHP